METKRHLNPRPISNVISNSFFVPIFHFPVLSFSIILNKIGYRKIPKKSPSMYKPL